MYWCKALEQMDINIVERLFHLLILCVCVYGVVCVCGVRFF